VNLSVYKYAKLIWPKSPIPHSHSKFATQAIDQKFFLQNAHVFLPGQLQKPVWGG
jgi:hypothetical protein